MAAKKGSKTPPAKKPAAKAKATPAAPPGRKPPPAKKSAKAKSEPRAAAARATRAALAGEDRKNKLGTKWTCYDCSAKFYDLNAPVPLCPKCGADQRTKPKVQATPPPAPPPRPREHRPLALLDDDDATRDDEALGPEDLDLELAGIGDEEELAEAPDLGLGEEEEEVGEED
jgi:hypothetical protein